MAKVFLFFFLLIAVSHSLADDSCSDKDLRPLMGKIRDQRDKGWCFANVAADLLTFAHRDQLSQGPISSSFMAIQYNAHKISTAANQENFDIFDNAGIVWQTLNTVQEKMYVCPQSVDEVILNQGLKADLSEKLEIFRTLHKYRHKENLTPAEMDTVSQLIKNLQESKSILSLYPRKKIEDALSEKSFTNAVLQVTDLFCNENKERLKKNVQFADYFTNTEKIYDGTNGGYEVTSPINYLHEINKALQNDKPVAILYDTKHVLNSSSTNELHTSILVGRKQTESGCQYLVRNSWAESCQDYIYPCENGHFWIPESKLQDITLGITFEKFQ